MGQLEISHNQVANGTKLSAALFFAVVFLAVFVGVCWCGQLAWHEPTPTRTESSTLDLIVTPDPALCKWLPVVAAGASLVIAVAHRLAGSNSIRFLATAAGLVVLQAVTAGIEVLMR